MAIGKQGAYATVEGGVVDFGKITTEAIDKYQTQQALQEKLKQEKEAAKQKAIADEVKNLKSLDKYSPSGVYGVDNPALSAVAQYRDRIDEVQRQVERGEISSVQANQLTEKANQSLAVLNSGAAYIKQRAEDFNKNVKLYNHEFIKPDAMESMLKDTTPVVLEDGSMQFHYKNGDKEIVTSNPKEIADLIYNIPLDVNITEKIGEAKKAIEQDKIAAVKGGFVVTETQQSEQFKSSISKTAQNWVTDPDVKAKLWSDYERTLPEDKRVGPKKDGFSEEQNKALYKYTNDLILNSYPKESSMTNIPKSGGGSGTDKDKDVRTVTKFKAPAGGIGNAYGISENKRGEGVIYKSINIGGKDITNYDAKQFWWNAKGDLVVSGTYESIKTSRTMPKKDMDQVNLLEKIKKTGKLDSEQQEQYDELARTYGSTKNKQAATINKDREDLIEPIATKLGYGSVDEFVSTYRPNISAKPATTKTNVNTEALRQKYKY